MKKKPKQFYTCFMCNEDLSEKNSSVEHIILNACGGKLKSKNLLCKKCNELIGSESDSILANQLNFMSVMVNVDRDKGELPPITGCIDNKGNDYKLIPGEIVKPLISKPQVILSKQDNKTEIQIHAGDTKTFNKLLKQLNNKFPHFDIDKAIQKSKNTKFYLKEPLKYSHNIGGESAFRSIVKTAIEFFIFSGGNSVFIKHLIPYLKGTNDLNAIWFFPIEPFPYSLGEKEISHLIYVKADDKEKICYAFVDFFNSNQYLVCLNDNYSGVGFENLYCYDLINKKKINKSFNIKFNHDDVIKFSSKRELTKEEFKIIESRIKRTFSLANKNQIEINKSKLFEKAFQNAFEKSGRPARFTEEMLNILMSELAQEYLPFFLHIKGIK